ncbi:MAG: FecR family protein [Candidatus Cyclobacteriaceae bacterium M3_2C_046]
MSKRNIEKIIREYLTGRESKEGQTLFNQWFQSFEDNYNPLSQVEASVKKNQMLKRIYKNIPSDPESGKVKQSKLYFISWKIAAVVVLLIVSSVILYSSGFNRSNSPNWLLKETVSGQKAIVTLPDGSSVKLNSNSSLKYPDNFDANLRPVFLEGEGFFEISKDPKRPFEVFVGDIKLMVLGTSFNVKSSKDSSVVIAVNSGKVKVATQSKPEAFHVLVPEDVLLFDHQNSKFKKSSGSLHEITGWKDGLLIFNNNSLDEVADKLEQWYGVTIENRTNPDTGCVVTGKHRNESLINVLEALQFSMGIYYKYDQKKYVLFGNCK